MTPEEYRKKFASQKRSKERKNKYNARKIITQYGRFDSAHEHSCYLDLLDRAMRKEITELHRQVKFELIPAHYEMQTKQLKTKTKEVRVCIEEACSYIADFTYMEEGKFHVVDAKGVKTEVYKIKKKLMLWIHGIKIEEI